MIKLGKNAKIQIGANEVARMNSFNFTVTNTTVPTDSFGDDFDKSVIVKQGWSASIEGYYDDDDTYNSNLQSLALSGGEIDDLRLYVDSSSYYAPDTVTDTEATAIIESFNPTAEKSGIVSFTMAIKGSGPIKKTTS